ncbi:hypothetical protein BT67DRAFT_134237 [Trichocladium antarcticum]|uniref:Uncharacterized protein n=1 Tax=Trichocladium antarcticum TaxID=1450529 RepID=A0AAN6UG28_9PEZI|nr:hypothetical protein BT67DRAFT_134237 [Trichocladium antarcticum]
MCWGWKQNSQQFGLFSGAWAWCGACRACQDPLDLGHGGGGALHLSPTNQHLGTTLEPPAAEPADLSGAFDPQAFNSRSSGLLLNVPVS